MSTPSGDSGGKCTAAVDSVLTGTLTLVRRSVFAAVLTFGLALLAACGSAPTVAKPPVRTTDAEVCRALDAVLTPASKKNSEQAADDRTFYKVASESSDAQVRSAGRVLLDSAPAPPIPPDGVASGPVPRVVQAATFIQDNCGWLGLSPMSPLP